MTDHRNASEPARFGIVGRGWRADFYHRLARTMPDRFTVTGVVTRTEHSGAEVTRTWQVPTFRSVTELIEQGSPEFVVVSVPRTVTPEVIGAVVDRGVPVLAETPPAADVPGLRALWSRVGETGLVQVAEQYPLLPGHAAQLAVLRSGAIGEVSSAQVCSTHLYHAVAIMRAMLDTGFAAAAVRAQTFTAPLADPLSRAGWSGTAEPKDATTTLAIVDFGGRVGVYDFTDNQWFNPLRTNRIVLRGSLGEVVDDRIARLADPATVVEERLVRRQTGIDLNLEGFALDHISHNGAPLYRNPFPGIRLSDEDIAIGTLLDRMAAWCRTAGPPPYPLAEACQDQLIALALLAAARRGATVRTDTQPWAS